jgi:hypothetical protein
MKRFAYIVLGGLIIVSGAAGIAVPVLAQARRQSRLRECANNLGLLWKMQWVNKCQFSSRKPFLRNPGKEFWLALSKTSPPLIDVSVAEVYSCPVRGGGRPGETHYLGPRVDVNTLSDGDPVGCDEPFNHSPDGSEGGHVLRKSGDLMEVSGPDWLRFFEEKQCLR